jgi:hypothetical protein
LGTKVPHTSFDSLDQRAAKVCHKPSMAMAAHSIPSQDLAKVAVDGIRIFNRSPLKVEAPKVSLPTSRLTPQISFFDRLRLRREWWALHAPPHVLRLILQGVPAAWQWHHPPVLHICPSQRSMEDQKDALLILEDYRQVGAVKEVSLSGTQFLVPWFIVRKPEGDGIKSRLIADCRQLNQFLETKHFKLDHWKQIFPVLRKGMWACKVDLKHAYFHLGLAKELRPFVRLNVGEKVFEFQAACFGLNQLPQLWMSVMKVFQKLWRNRAFFVSFTSTTFWSSDRPFIRLSQVSSLCSRPWRPQGWLSTKGKAHWCLANPFNIWGSKSTFRKGHFKYLLKNSNQ